MDKQNKIGIYTFRRNMSLLICHFDQGEKSAALMRFLTIVPLVSANGIASREMTAIEIYD